jgi:hypothetical protein
MRPGAIPNFIFCLRYLYMQVQHMLVRHALPMIFSIARQYGIDRINLPFRRSALFLKAVPGTGTPRARRPGDRGRR